LKLPPLAEKVLKNTALAIEMDRKGREHVENKFLITRLLIDYLDLLAGLLTTTPSLDVVWTILPFPM
jgi:hypothetical protein